MKRLEALAVILVALVLIGTPVAAFAGQRYLNAPPHEYTIVAHTAEDGGFTPSQTVVTQGEHVRLRLTSADVVHGLYVSGLDVQVPEIYPGRYATVEFTPAEAGTYPFVCTSLCSPLHGNMQGTIVVLPAGKEG